MKFWAQQTTKAQWLVCNQRWALLARSNPDDNESLIHSNNNTTNNTRNYDDAEKVTVISYSNQENIKMKEKNCQDKLNTINKLKTDDEQGWKNKNYIFFVMNLKSGCLPIILN